MHRRFNSALFSLSSSSNYELKFSMWETFVEVPVSNKTVKCQGNYIYSLSQPTPPFFPPPHSGELDSSNGGAERVERTRPPMTLSTLSLSWELASSSTIAPIADHAHVRCEHGCSLRAALTSAPLMMTFRERIAGWRCVIDDVDVAERCMSTMADKQHSQYIHCRKSIAPHKGVDPRIMLVMSIWSDYLHLMWRQGIGHTITPKWVVYKKQQQHLLLSKRSENREKHGIVESLRIRLI